MTANNTLIWNPCMNITSELILQAKEVNHWTAAVIMSNNILIIGQRLIIQQRHQVGVNSLNTPFEMLLYESAPFNIQRSLNVRNKSFFFHKEKSTYDWNFNKVANMTPISWALIMLRISG